METFHIYQPKANGKTKVDKVEVFANLLGFGEENAIKRDELTSKCVEAGLISPDTKDKDRAMRNILRNARREYVILNNCKGDGYYRPTPKELARLSKSNKREKGRALDILGSNKMANALEQDYKHERIVGGD